MEASEAFRRIVIRHRLLITVLVVLPLAAVVPWRLHKVPSYQANARIQAQSAAPDVTTQAAAILDRASAVAVSPDVVRAAITAAHVQLPRSWVASKQISATSLGGSAVIVLSVNAPTRAEATALGRTLPGAVVTALNRLATQQTAPALDALNQQARQLTSQRDALLVQLNNPSIQNAASASANVSALLAELTAVNSQLSNVMSSQQQLLTTASTNGSAGVISLAAAATPTSSGVVTYGVLAALLGLVVGLLAASVHELARPSVADAGTAARQLDVPVLGRLDSAHGVFTPADAGMLTRIDLAAERAEVETLVVTGAITRKAQWEVAARLDRLLADARAPLASAESNGGGGQVGWWDRCFPEELADDDGPDAATLTATRLSSGVGRHVHRLRAVPLGELAPGARPAAPALVAVIPEFGPHRELDRISDLAAGTGWPVLGVIGVRMSRRRARRGSRRRTKGATDVTELQDATEEGDSQR